jgi:hypothetical protein
MAPPPTPRPNNEITVIWRARLEKAKAAYDVAVAEFRRLSAEFEEKEMPRSDSGLALRQAVAAENEARRRYANILQQFTDLIVNGTWPPEG